MPFGLDLTILDLRKHKQVSQRQNPPQPAQFTHTQHNTWASPLTANLSLLNCGLHEDRVRSVLLIAGCLGLGNCQA